MYEWLASQARVALIVLIALAGLTLIGYLASVIADYLHHGRKYNAYIKSIKDPAVRAKVEKEYKRLKFLDVPFEPHDLSLTWILTEEEFKSYLECVDDPETRERLWGHFLWNHRRLYWRADNMPRFTYDWEKGTYIIEERGKE